MHIQGATVSTAGVCFVGCYCVSKRGVRQPPPIGGHNNDETCSFRVNVNSIPDKLKILFIRIAFSDRTRVRQGWSQRISQGAPQFSKCGLRAKLKSLKLIILVMRIEFCCKIRKSMAGTTMGLLLSSDGALGDSPGYVPVCSFGLWGKSQPRPLLVLWT